MSIPLSTTPNFGAMNSLPRKSSLQSSTSKLFSQAFLENLKAELLQKIKPSRAILQGLKHATALNNALKTEVEQLRARLREIESQQGQIKSSLSVGHFQQSDSFNLALNLPHTAIAQQSPKSKTAQNTLQKTQYQQKLHVDLSKTATIVPRLSINCVYSMIVAMKEDSFIEQKSSDSLTFLKRKIKELEEYGRVREERYNQLVEKQAHYASQIELLSNRNLDLTAQVSGLKEQLSRIDPLATDDNVLRISHDRVSQIQEELDCSLRSYINLATTSKKSQKLI